MKITKIAIKFGDNDFYNTFIPLLESLGNAMTFSGLELDVVDKNLLLSLINSLSYGFYLMCQNKFEYENAGTEDYLKIPDRKLLINDEVDEHILKCGAWDNSETFCLYINDERSQVPFTVTAI